MAKGVITDALTLFPNETYSGDSGTETNPYCIEDLEDFLAINNLTDETCYLLLVNNIDFNDHPEYCYGINVTELIKKTTYYLLGNNKEIRNVIVKYKQTVSNFALFWFAEIRDLKFVNFVNLGSSVSPFYAKLVNCSISAYFSKPMAAGCRLNYEDFWRCSLNLKGIVNTSLTLGNLHYSHVNLDIDFIYSSSSTGQFTCINCTLDNSYITGKCLDNSESSSRIEFIKSLANWTNSYIAITCKNSSPSWSLKKYRNSKFRLFCRSNSW